MPAKIKEKMNRDAGFNKGHVERKLAEAVKADEKKWQAPRRSEPREVIYVERPRGKRW